jgi:hypothetical protein
LAKSKTKAAVKRKPAKTQARVATARAAKAVKKAAPAKSTKTGAAKPAKATLAKAAAGAITEAKAAAAKAAVTKTPTVKAPTIKAPAVTPRSERKAGPLTLPAARQSATPLAHPAPAVRKPTVPAAPRADLPPAAGFTLLVDGHFKNQFDDLKGAKAAASELKSRFPMLRVEIYDAVNKARLPA